MSGGASSVVEVLSQVRLFMDTNGITPYFAAILLIATIAVLYDRFFSKA